MDIQSFDTNGEAINAIELATNKHLFIAQSNRVDLYATDSKTLITSYKGHNKPVNTLAFNTLTSFVSCSDVITLNDISKETYIRRITMDTKFKINDVIKLTSDVIACCGEDHKVNIFDLRQRDLWKPIQVFNDSNDTLNGLSYCEKRKMIISCGNEGLFSYDLRRGLVTKDDLDCTITSCDIQNDYLLLSSLGTVKIWDLKEQKVSKQFSKETNDKEYKIDSKFLSNGKIVSGSEHGKLYLFPTTIGMGPPSSIINTVGVYDSIICCGRDDGQVHIVRV